MEDALALATMLAKGAFGSVLILVVMEDALAQLKKMAHLPLCWS